MPAPLLALIAVALIVGTAWTVVISPLQQPDESNHMARIQRMAEGGQLKTPVTRDWSTDETFGAGAVKTLELPGFGTVKPPFDRAADAAYRATADSLTAPQRRDADAPTGADTNPPLYYWWGAAWYHLGGDFLTRAWVIRLSGVLLLAATVTGAWLLVGEAVGRRRILQTAGAGFVALQPMAGSISSAVSPDSLLIAGSTFALWLMVRTLRRGPTRGNLLGLLAAVLAAAFAKSSALALVPAALVAVTIAVARTEAGRRRLGDRSRRQTAGLVAGGVAVVAALAVALRLLAPLIAPQLAGPLENLPNPRYFASYLWQFYLGRAGFLSPTPNLGPDARLHLVWIEQGWGRFGPLDSQLAPVWFTVIAWAGVLVIVAALAALVAHRRRVDVAVPVVLGLAAVATLLGLHVTEFGLLTSFLSGPILQGRYILPLIGVGAVVVATALSLLPDRWRAPAAGLLLSGMAVMVLNGLFAAASRYYAF